jgi:hypothetical protein
VNLQLKNLFRWIWYHLFEWLLLGGLYVVGLTILLRGLYDSLEEVGRLDWTFFVLVAALLLLPVIQWGVRKLNAVSMPIPLIRSRRLLAMLAVHEMRKPSSFVIMGAQTVMMAIFLAQEGRGIHLVLASQLYVQSLLYSVRLWIPFAQKFHPRTGAIDLYVAMTAFSGLAILPSASAAVLISGTGSYDVLSVLSGVIGANLAASMMCLEGDGGRPWLVNLFSMLAGTFFGLICFQFSWVVLLLLYLYPSMMGYVRGRHRSLEYFDEDVTIP